MKTQAGDLTLNEPTGRGSTSFRICDELVDASLKSRSAIFDRDPSGRTKRKRLALWYGFAVIRTISENGLTFDLFENGTESQLSLRDLSEVIRFPV